jgi:hypothetical protein
MKRWMLFPAVLLALAGNGESYSKGGPPGVGRTAVTLEEPAPAEAAPRVISSGDVAAMVMLLGFLGLIGRILMCWSADTSWKERSVVPPSVVSDPLIK